jgi:hypothetical protein
LWSLIGRTARFLKIPAPADDQLGMRRIPVPILVTLAVLLAAGPLVLLVSAHEGRAAAPPDRLAEIAERAGCALTDFDDGSARSNPPVTGRFVERILAADGSYAGRRPPSPIATMHALLHGRVLFQYRHDTGRDELRALDRLTRSDPDQVLLFQNQTGMRAHVAATAYLSRITCPRADRAALGALAAFRDRRRAFGQGF